MRAARWRQKQGNTRIAHREVNQKHLLGSLSREALFRLVPRGGFQAGGAAVPNPIVGCPGLCKNHDAKWWERQKTRDKAWLTLKGRGPFGRGPSTQLGLFSQSSPES